MAEAEHLLTFQQRGKMVTGWLLATTFLASQFCKRLGFVGVSGFGQPLEGVVQLGNKLADRCLVLLAKSLKFGEQHNRGHRDPNIWMTQAFSLGAWSSERHAIAFWKTLLNQVGAGSR